MSRMRTWFAFSFPIMFLGLWVARAGDAFPIQELKFDARTPIFASKSGDQATYLLLGSGFFRALAAKNENEFIKHWLELHPSAKATPISTMNASRVGLPPDRLVYVWIEDGAVSLNVDLIEEGIYSGGVMLDMVESQQHLLEEMKDPLLTSDRERMEKEIAEQTASDRPKRLITDEDYADRRKRIEAAENRARKGKKGIWSDAMKEEREAEGLN